MQAKFSKSEESFEVPQLDWFRVGYRKAGNCLLTCGISFRFR